MVLAVPDEFAPFRQAARGLLAEAVPPHAIAWSEGEPDLFAGASAAPTSGGVGDRVGPAPDGPCAPPVAVPARFLPLAEEVIRHRAPERFALLYEALWRITQGERALLQVASDPLVHRLERMRRAVSHDAHRMTAFLRFREAGPNRFVAWYEPAHRVLRQVAPFFTGRFAAMHWAILTPDASLAWDGSAACFGPGVSRDAAPCEDALETWWQDYYRATFNPARANETALRRHIPRRFWRNLPEAETVPELLSQAGRRTAAMTSEKLRPVIKN
ncbi:MAG: TIGR03915 family putative DNA repair protein [Rhodospirillales bacterium]|nr:TIGR03915 family putative DNA repair protein [Rhodospirillales bacterium]